MIPNEYEFIAKSETCEIEPKAAIWGIRRTGLEKWGDGEHTFEKGAVIQITQDIEISSDGDFDAYEFYQVKDKSSFYNA